MTPRRLGWTAGAALALVAVAVVLEVALPRWRAARDDARDLLLPADAPPLARFTLERGGIVAAFEPAPDGGTLIRVAGRPDLRGDTRAVTALDAALRGARIAATVIEDAQGTALEAHGLAPPRATLSWSDARGPRSLALGRPALGEKLAHALAHDGRIVLVPLAVLEAADQDLDAWRAKSVLALDPMALVRVTVVRAAEQLPPGAATRLVMERDPVVNDAIDLAPWRLVEPLAFEANTRRLEGLLSRIASLQARAFGPDAPTPGELADTGLAAPAVEVILETAAGATRLRIGHPVGNDRAWARADEGPAVQVDSAFVHELLLPQDFWRDARAVKLPPLSVVNVRVHAGGLDLELARDHPRAPWSRVPPDATPPDEVEVQLLLTKIDDLQCGRFEDELSADPDHAERRWDFDAPGGVKLSVQALLSDGTPRSVDAEMVPFVRQRTVYFALRATGSSGRTDVCIVQEKDVDGILDQARALAGPAAAP